MPRNRYASLIVLAGAALIGVTMIVGSPSTSARSLDEARLLARPHIQALAARHHLGSADDLSETRSTMDRLGMLHQRVQQRHGGVPVFGAEAIVHLRHDGSLFSITDSLLSDVDSPSEPLLGPRDAEDLAVRYYGCRHCLTDRPESSLWILRSGGDDRLVYRVRLRREDGTNQTALPVIFIDARDGEKVWEYDGLQTASGTGASLYSGTVPVETLLRFGRFYLEDTGRKAGTFDARNGSFIFYRFKDTNNVWDSAAQRAGVDAHYGAASFLDYLSEVHGRDGIDGLGGPGYLNSTDRTTKLITSRVHYGAAYNNAFWNGRFMTYGDGDGFLFSPLVTLDIAGHEMMHGVTEHTAGLLPLGESGALNESWSDVFGALSERRVRGDGPAVWHVGEDAFTPGNGTVDALRYLDDPHQAANGGFTLDDDPDHYSERYQGLGDNAGVHINAGISNKAFFLLAEGGTHHLGGSMTGIGVDDAADIWYLAITSYMTVTTNFLGAREATLAAASALYGEGSAQHLAVGQAWCLVGVGTTCGLP